MDKNDEISADWKQDNNGIRAAFEEDLKEVKVECTTKLKEDNERKRDQDHPGH